ncbi:hypothetical protein PAECIP111891_00137 [Paenibacillus allorhizoplanae]|uniref:Mannosylglycerate hydrolase MGH1-like glycoside hydrolase domain-containing protein n=1 Tax=Paenibacillus allorhizoplanae TaxID=2905648 RepID=A0ABN8FT20_9BACL|nr:trehalase family glycosidase [Paenibacillus allorhizoplanae]CAH1191908.1 hypothetical protein PAECIP111891_00137 [Paenibacillus allorhizoplanae]
MQNLVGTHDQKGLPSWGPFTKKYMGISHIANSEQGIRFDLSVFPGFYRRKVDIPSVMWESGYHPWEASPDLSYYSHRHELEWKDQVYADIAYASAGADIRLIRCKLVNRTEAEQNLVLHWMASLHLPQVHSHGKVLQIVEVEHPEGAVWLDALDYEDLVFATPRITDRLVYDGLYRAEVRAEQFVKGSGIGMGFAQEKGDQVSYQINLSQTLSDAELGLRFRLPKGESVRFSIAGHWAGSVELLGTGKAEVVEVNIGRCLPGTLRLDLIAQSEGSRHLELDGIFLVERAQKDLVKFNLVSTNVHPELIQGPVPNSLILQYEGIDHVYGMLWQFEDYEIKQYHTDELDRFMRHNVHHHVHPILKGEGEGHFTNVYLRPIPLSAQSEKTLYGMVTSGSLDEVNRVIVDWNVESPQYLNAFVEGESKIAAFEHEVQPEGKQFAFSQQLLSATLLTNIVYPVYTKRSYIRHYTPGRWWDCLYTWDSGFVGLGLAQLDTQRAIECLNAYMTDPGDTQAAFIHHGSMVPVQHYLFLELWNKTQSKELLEHFYPRLRQYYLFYAGKSEGSATRTLQSGLLKTWDYFYNSGGWDDYPPQVHVHKQKLRAEVAPISNSCHGIRIAKILKMAATAIGRLQDHVKEYDNDIASFSSSIQQNSWDEEAGYFGYVVHDQQGNPTGLLRHESGHNYNMGLDGAYPLVAGITSKEQEDRLLDYLQDPSRLWSPIGLSTVDQSAPYYRADGYWNGAVWMPHQWFMWKAMLSHGRSEGAHRIAYTALGLWKKEAEQTYNCYEHFIVQSGRGAGWHHFGGLSTPVLNWFAAYYRPGTLTCGYDVWVSTSEFSKGNTSLYAEIRYFGDSTHEHTIIACMNFGHQYRVLWNGQEIKVTSLSDGTLEIRLPGEIEGRLSIEALE